MFYTLLYFIFYFLFKLLYRFSVSGKERIPEAGPVILAANHSSYLDPIALGVAVYPRKIHFMAKEELFRIPFFSFLITRLNAFPVRRERLDKKSLKIALSLLSRQKAIGLFPEGTRVKREGFGQVYQGAAFLSLKTSSPILPVAISGTDKIMPAGTIIPRFPKITIQIGRPIDPREIEGSQKKERMGLLMEKVLLQLSEMLEDRGKSNEG